MGGLHSLTDEQEQWLLMVAVPRKAALSRTMPVVVQRALILKGLIGVLNGWPRATPEGRAELLRVMLLHRGFSHFVDGNTASADVVHVPG
jgi:hypothetical protein